MTGRSKTMLSIYAVVVVVFTFCPAGKAQEKRALITEEINETHLTSLAGNTRPEANAANDRGAVSPDFQFDHMLLLLKRAPELELALQQFIDDLHNPHSPSYHKWLSAEEFGQRYGVAQSDLEAVTAWLQSHGFTVNVVYANNMVVDFSGSASQIQEAFHTEIHHYAVNGEDHVANVHDPKIPATLAHAVAGIVSLNDFKLQAANRPLKQAHIDPRSQSFEPGYTEGSGFYTVVPADLQTIYNIKPLLGAGISGQGMKIVVVEDSNLYNCNSTNSAGNTPGTPCSSTSDWAVFRNTFGLGKYTAGNLSQENPAPQTGTNNCLAPGTGPGEPAGSGINLNGVESAIDVEWATAAAPSASIVNAACSDALGYGPLIAIQNILSHPNADNVDVISMSYLFSEEFLGAAFNAAVNLTFQQAVTQGIGVFVCAGDQDAASSDLGGTATHGIAISGLMSSPYDVSVGGLDFADTYFNLNSTYWNSFNNVFYGSAKSYIMEQPWNDSCAGTLLSNYLTGSPIAYGSSGFCNTATGEFFRGAVGGGGGPSACATGSPSVPGVAGGTCAGWAKPTYQSNYLGSMAGLQNDGVRDTPDVSLMAAAGLWGHYYVVCYSDTSQLGNDGAPCTGRPNILTGNWSAYGGTSISSPIMAAIQSLVVQHKGSLQGLPNYRYYQLAADEFGASGNPSCDSTLGNGVGKSCIFYDVTIGDNDAACRPQSNGTLNNCYLPSGTVGVLSTDNNSYQPAFSATTGWDFASGLGSVDAWNLVMSY